MKTYFQFLISFPARPEDDYSVSISADMFEIALVEAYNYACKGGNTAKFSLMFQKTWASTY